MLFLHLGNSEKTWLCHNSKSKQFQTNKYYEFQELTEKTFKQIRHRDFNLRSGNCLFRPIQCVRADQEFQETAQGEEAGRVLRHRNPEAGGDDTQAQDRHRLSRESRPRTAQDEARRRGDLYFRKKIKIIVDN